MGFFYKHKPHKFNYIPRFYDPEKEAWEQKKAAMGCDSNLSHEEQLRLQMRKSWGTLEDEQANKAEQREKLIRRVVWGALLLFIFYFIFCTPVLTNIVSGLMGK